MTRFVPLPVCALALLALAACQPAGQGTSSSATPTPASAAAKSAAAPRWEELRGATFLGFEESEQPVTLVDGHWEGAPFVEGGASRPTIDLIEDLRLVGDLDGDGGEEAVVLLAGSSGGSGTFSYLAAVGRDGAAVANLGTALLGDRVQLRSARTDGRRIVVDLVQAGPDDAACCPGDLVTRTFELSGAGLTEPVPPAVTGRLGLDTIADGEWVLRAWDLGEPAPAAPEVTLTMKEGRLGGSAGCNSYSAGVTAGDAPGELALGPAVSTRKACPPPEMEVEDRYLRQLEGARRFGFQSGRLALSCALEDGIVTMLFERR